MSRTVSVIIPVFNRRAALERAVQSVLSQDTIDCQLIVVDDGSTEDLTQIADRVHAAGGSFLRQQRSGVAAARNHGITVAEGDWIAFLDSDDFWHPLKLYWQLQFHRTHTRCLVSQTDEHWFWQTKEIPTSRERTHPSGAIFQQCLDRCCVSPSSVLVHRSVFDAVGLFDVTFPACEDYELWLRVAARYRIGVVSEKLVTKFGGSPDQLSRYFPAMDRFRVAAQLKLLEEAVLTTAQRQQTLHALSEKLRILATGEKKHVSTIAGLAKQLLAKLQENQSLTNSQLQQYRQAFRATWLREECLLLNPAEKQSPETKLGRHSCSQKCSPGRE